MSLSRGSMPTPRDGCGHGAQRRGGPTLLPSRLEKCSPIFAVVIESVERPAVVVADAPVWEFRRGILVRKDS